MESGYYKCKHCDNGRIIIDINLVRITYCYICGGSGKLDWIENVVGHHKKLKVDKWRHYKVIYNNKILKYYIDNYSVAKEDFITDVKIKDINKDFNISFWMTYTGRLDNIEINKWG